MELRNKKRFGENECGMNPNTYSVEVHGCRDKTHAEIHQFVEDTTFCCRGLIDLSKHGNIAVVHYYT